MELVCSRCKQSSIPTLPGTPASATFLCRRCCAEITARRITEKYDTKSIIWMEPADAELLDVAGLESYENVQGAADDFESETLPSVETEARELFDLAKNGSINFEEIVNLIAIPDQTVAALKRFDKLNHTQLFRVVIWRRKVLEKFISLHSSECISSAA